MAESFQDRLNVMAAEAEAIREGARRTAAIQRRDDFLAGQATASDIIGRVSRYGSTYQRNATTLSQAAQHQPPTLAGRVAAGDLSEAAQAAQKEADRLAMAEQLARDEAAVQERYYAAAARQAERGWDRERER